MAKIFHTLSSFVFTPLCLWPFCKILSCAIKWISNLCMYTYIHVISKYANICAWPWIRLTSFSGSVQLSVTSVLQAMESWVGPGNEARIRYCCWFLTKLNSLQWSWHTHGYTKSDAWIYHWVVNSKQVLMNNICYLLLHSSDPWNSIKLH